MVYICLQEYIINYFLGQKHSSDIIFTSQYKTINYLILNKYIIQFYGIILNQLQHTNYYAMQHK